METIVLRNGPLSFTALASGPPDGPVVLLLHGFPDSPHTFKGQLTVLADAGFRAIAPTMRGYEPSSQPANHDYRVGTMARDVLAWLDDLEVEHAHLIGHDWGAAVTFVAGALAPDRFHSLTAMAVPHAPRMMAAFRSVPVQMLNTWYMGFFQLPWLPEWAIERNDWAMLRRLSSKWSPGLSFSAKEWDERRETFEASGVKRAMLAYYRQNVSLGVLLGRVPSEMFSLRTVPVRTLAVSGLNDGCMDARLFDKVFRDEDFPCGHQLLHIENAGHFMHLDVPEVVNRALLDWLKQ